MTKAKAKSEFYKGTSIPNTLLDELMKQLPAMPTQEDLFGPEGVVKQLSAALIERCLQAELSTHLGYEKKTASRRGSPEPSQWVCSENAQKRCWGSRVGDPARPGGQLRSVARQTRPDEPDRLYGENPVAVCARSLHARYPGADPGLVRSGGLATADLQCHRGGDG